MIEEPLYYFKQPNPENPSKSITSFFKSFEAALEAMDADLQGFFSGAEIGVAIEYFGLNYERTGEASAQAEFEEFEWSVGKVS